MSDLTERERMLAVMVRCGLKNREIAEKIGIRPEVVRNYLRLIYRKLGITGGVGTKRVKLAVMVVEERKRIIHHRVPSTMLRTGSEGAEKGDLIEADGGRR